MYFIILALLLYSFSAASTEDQSHNWDYLKKKIDTLFNERKSNSTIKNEICDLFKKAIETHKTTTDKLQSEIKDLNSTLKEKETFLKGLQEKNKESVILLKNENSELNVKLKSLEKSAEKNDNKLKQYKFMKEKIQELTTENNGLKTKLNEAKSNNITNNNEGVKTIVDEAAYGPNQQLRKSVENANRTKNLAIGVALAAIGILAVNTVMSKQTAAAFAGNKN